MATFDAITYAKGETILAMFEQWLGREKFRDGSLETCREWATEQGIDTLILGCTHYEIVADLFRAALPPGTPLIHQPQATADVILAAGELIGRRPYSNAGGRM